ncbi:FkbM family methyltransferase [Hymenobacter crusticola]|uniref:Methyltransferase FkbM domain-containing protein n=1 Tax=Hymenobacter crusticola TaxID=1770526 RepID=A0A243WC18_9BACT|nr:FkbM family methyltransferase [Hymenobacter crusticola]OUJ73151.1 hypothetical protein BXP70_15090 [Hymenobacter crusticola]
MSTLKIVKRVNNLFAVWSLTDAFRLVIGSRLSSFRNDRFRKLVNDRDNIEELRNSNYNVVKNNNYFTVEDGLNKIFCRRFSSDLDVVKQIFVQDEFKDLFKIINQNNICVNSIIDAGGNIGLSTIKFSNVFPKSKIITIEPDADNFKVLQKNVKANNVSAILIKKGIWNKSCKLYFDRSFRDGKEWSISLTEEANSSDFVEAVSINDIVKDYSLEEIDLLKIDIEGGERFIFNETGFGLEFLKITKIVAIEIHDEYDIENKILDILKKDFSISRSGEYVIGVRK